MSGKLTPKQAMFVAEYLIDGNATRAAIAAGFASGSAAVTGARLLKSAKVAAAIAERQKQRQKKLEVSADRVLEELARLAYFDPGNLYDEKGNRIPVERLDEDTRRAVSSVEDSISEKDGVIRRRQYVKMADKGQNLERLGRYLKLFTDRVEHDGKLDVDGGLTDQERANRISALLLAAKSRKNGK